MKIRTNFIAYSSAYSYTILKMLIRKSPPALINRKRWQYEEISTLRKVWPHGSSFDLKQVDNRYNMNDLMYRFCHENDAVPSSEFGITLEDVNLPLLSKLRKHIEKDGSQLILAEYGYSDAPHMEHRVDLQLDYLWSHLNEISIIPCLSATLRHVYNETSLSTWLGCGTEFNLPPIEHKRTHNHCTYFNDTLQYVLTTIFLLGFDNSDSFLLESDVNAAIGDFIQGFKNRKRVTDITMPNGLVLLTKGKLAKADSFPDYPTDVWLARFKEDSNEILGEYAIQLSDLDEQLSLPIDTAFPPQAFASEFLNYCHNDKNDFGYALLRYYQQVERQKLCDTPPPLLTHLSDAEKLALEIGNKDIDFSVRTFHCLQRANIKTVADILTMSKEDLTKIRNLGKKQIPEVISTIERLGFKIYDSNATENEDSTD